MSCRGARRAIVAAGRSPPRPQSHRHRRRRLLAAATPQCSPVWDGGSGASWWPPPPPRRCVAAHAMSHVAVLAPTRTAASSWTAEGVGEVYVSLPGPPMCPSTPKRAGLLRVIVYTGGKYGAWRRGPAGDLQAGPPLEHPLRAPPPFDPPRPPRQSRSFLCRPVLLLNVHPPPLFPTLAPLPHPPPLLPTAPFPADYLILDPY